MTISILDGTNVARTMGSRTNPDNSLSFVHAFLSEAAPGSDGTFAISIQGVTNGKALATTLTGAVPLPTGAATAGKQDSIISAISSVAKDATITSMQNQLHTDLTAATPAGSAIIGKVGIDQTTPGTTNLVSAAQSGTWNVTNISGTVSLPTGAATDAKLTTINTTLGTPFQAGGNIGNTSFGINGAIPAGSNIVGKFGIDQTTPGTTNGTVPSGLTANGSAPTENPILTSGWDGTTKRTLKTDANGSLQAVGNIAAGVADSGAPVKIGGFAQSSGPPTPVTAGQRVNSWFTLNGAQVVAGGQVQVAGDGSSNNIAGTSTFDGGAYKLGVTPFVFNGTTWDRQKKANLVLRQASSAASGNLTSAKTTATDLVSLSGVNTTSSIIYLHFYNKASAPVLGTDTPVWTYPIPATSAFSFALPTGGLYFSTGLAIALTTDIATIPATGAAAGAITALGVIYT